MKLGNIINIFAPHHGSQPMNIAARQRVLFDEGLSSPPRFDLFKRHHEHPALTKQKYFSTLDRWTKLAQDGENRAEAVRRIKEWSKGETSDAPLNLEGLNLRSLPGLPVNCKDLCLDNNKLSALPDNLPGTLECLSAEHNELTQLTAELPSKLKYLHVSHNRITTLPEKWPPTLELLDVGHNLLQAWPTNTPDSFRNLFAGNNFLDKYPENLSFVKLEYLQLQGNRLTHLPDSFQELDVKYLNLSNNPLAENVRLSLHEWNSQHRLIGPQVTFSADAQPSRPLENVIADLYQKHPEQESKKILAQWKEFNSEDSAKAFSTFVEKLQKTLNYHGSDSANSLREWLEHLTRNSGLRQKTFFLAEEASADCEDRISLTFNDMKKARIVDDIEHGQYDQRVPELIGLIRGLFRLDTIDTIAREKVKAIEATRKPTDDPIDEIEVSLAYQVKLRNNLQLPVDTVDMKYFKTSDLTEDDLRIAESRVKAEENQHFEQYLLTKCPVWQSTLLRLDSTSFALTKNDIESKKELLNGQLQAKLEKLMDKREQSWIDAANTLPNRFAEQSNNIAERCNRELTKKILEKTGVPLSQLAPFWRAMLN